MAVTDAERAAMIPAKTRHEIYQRNQTGEGQVALSTAFDLPRRTVQAVIKAVDREINADEQPPEHWDSPRFGWRVHGEVRR